MTSQGAALVTLCREIAPCDPLEAFARGGGERLYWERPGDELAIATEGCATAIETRGARRFARVDGAIRAALSRSHVFDDAAPLSPFFVGGFAFDEEPADDGIWRGFPAATLRITVELAARFCADAHEETYFGWDRERFASASAHNQARATSQLHLAGSIAADLATLEIETERAFS